MQSHDDDLARFAAEGAPPLPQADEEGATEHDGARIWYASYGAGPAVVLLHGGLGHSGNWGNQVPALVAAGYQAIVLDTRGHGRSTRDERPLHYAQLARDTTAVMDRLGVERAALVGWSDGACTAMLLADHQPERAAGVFFFACNMDPSGAKELEPAPILERCISRHIADYRALSPAPDAWDAFTAAVGKMQGSEPNYTAEDLARITVPVAIVQSEHDEFIRPEHAAYLARSIPGAELIELPGVSHFAPLQRPELFNAAMLGFVGRALR